MGGCASRASRRQVAADDFNSNVAKKAPAEEADALPKDLPGDDSPAASVLPIAYDSAAALISQGVVGLGADADIRLLQAGHVIDLWRAGGRFKPRQSLPESAFLAMTPVFIIVLSYGWLAKGEPDADGWHLGIVGPLLDLFVRSGIEAGKISSAAQVGFFIDFCSLWQAPRSDKQRESFGRGLRNANYLYANRHTYVWAQTKMPAGTLRGYHSRGWTFFELIVASLVKEMKAISPRPPSWDRKHPDALGDGVGLDVFLKVRLLDLSKLEPTERELKLGIKSMASAIDPAKEPDFHRVAHACSGGVMRAPLSLEAFGDELGQREFTNGKSDHDAVVELYRRTLDEVLGAITHLEYAKCGWGDADAVRLAAVLPRCVELRTLELRGNGQIGDEGAAAIIKNLPPGVTSLNLNRTRASCDLPREMLVAEDRGLGKYFDAPERLQFAREWAGRR